MLLVVAVVSSRDETPTGPRADVATPSPTEAMPTPPGERYVNERGGYSFELPAGWRARGRGARTNLRAPGDVAAVSIGLLDADSLASASRALSLALRESYENVKIESRDRQDVGTSPARSIAGTAVNRRGAELRFLAIAVEGQDRYYGINVFAPESSDPAVVLPPVQTIVSTFEAARS